MRPSNPPSKPKHDAEPPSQESERAYFNVSAPRPLMLRFEALIREHPELGYSSPSAAAVEGIRRFLLELEEKAAIARAVEGVGDMPLRLREQFAHEMILLAQRYLQKEKTALEEEGTGKTVKKQP